MNKDNAKDYLPLVQALADGKEVQILHSGEWHDIDDPSFTAPAVCHRIKPEPREVWVNEWKPAGKVVFDSPEEAYEHAKRYGIEHVTTHYREVVE